MPISIIGQENLMSTMLNAKGEPIGGTQASTSSSSSPAINASKSVSTLSATSKEYVPTGGSSSSHPHTRVVSPSTVSARPAAAIWHKDDGFPGGWFVTETPTLTPKTIHPHAHITYSMGYDGKLQVANLSYTARNGSKTGTVTDPSVISADSKAIDDALNAFFSS